MSVTIKTKEILYSITEEYNDIFPKNVTDDEKLQMLTSESMLALEFVTSLEDEFSIEFEDEEIDIEFFTNIEKVVSRINFHL